ncbi:MAG: hypothetical protein M1503_03115 [Thaumarchaeota archaeon]|nr:hypothetical protein [Nitrososphaerota archaeon]MCL5317242.1 hypothetical protein [Nitrososphaerota archaeon]
MASTTTAYTAKNIKEMDINHLTALMEKKLGKQISPSTRLLLAVAHGAGRAGSSICTVNLGSGEVNEETLNYERIAEFLNGPDRELTTKQYLSPKILIANPEHLAKLILFTIEHTPSPQHVNQMREKDPSYRSPIESLIDCLQFLTGITKEYEPTGYHFAVYPDGEYGLHFRGYDFEDRLVMDGGILLHTETQAAEDERLYNERMKWSVHT